jgi:hypothetical protein
VATSDPAKLARAVGPPRKVKYGFCLEVASNSGDVTTGPEGTASKRVLRKEALTPHSSRPWASEFAYQ